jgi:hypothetical protein
LPPSLERSSDIRGGPARLGEIILDTIREVLGMFAPTEGDQLLVFYAAQDGSPSQNPNSINSEIAFDGRQIA